MDKPASTAMPSQSQPPLGTQVQAQPQHSQVSIANLRNLSNALSAFQSCFAELQQHIDSIWTTIDSLLPPVTTNIVPLPESADPKPSRESNPSDEKGESPLSDLECLCESMNGSGLRKYMVTYISDIKGLREQVPKALKLSSNPARLVLETVGRFFLNGSKAYDNVKDSMQIRAREASVLVLECFLLMGNEGVEIDEGVKEEAEQAAVAWRKRMMAEVGISKANEMDARGLLLLIGCFGIPGKFTNKSIEGLLRVSNIKEISDALRRSNSLMARIPEIIEGMVKDKMEVDAVDIAYTFGIEDKYNTHGLLISFIQESKRLKKIVKRSQGSLVLLNEAKMVELSALRSVIRCLERHNIDPANLLPELQINEKIMSLEKSLVESSKKMGEKIPHKRKLDETDSPRRFSNKEVKQSHCANPWPQQQRVVNYVNSSSSTLLEGGAAAHISGYSVSPLVTHGPIAGLKNVVGSLAGTVRGMAVGGVAAGISPSAARTNHPGIAAGSDVLQAGSYAGGHGGALVDSTLGKKGIHIDQLYGWHGAVYDRLAPHSYAYRPSSYLGGSMALPNTMPSDAYRPSTYLEGSTELPNIMPRDAYRPPTYLEGITELPNDMPRDAYRPQLYLEGSTGLPNTIQGDAFRQPPYLEFSNGLPNTASGGVAGQSSTSDIYQVADTVTESELYRGSGSRIDAVPSAHPSSYLYWPR